MKLLFGSSALAVLCVVSSYAAFAAVEDEFKREVRSWPIYYDGIVEATVVDARVDTIMWSSGLCNYAYFMRLEPANWYWGKGPEEAFWTTVWTLPRELRSRAALYERFPFGVEADCWPVGTSDTSLDPPVPGLGQSGLFLLGENGPGVSGLYSVLGGFFELNGSTLRYGLKRLETIDLSDVLGVLHESVNVFRLEPAVLGGFDFLAVVRLSNSAAQENDDSFLYSFSLVEAIGPIDQVNQVRISKNEVLTDTLQQEVFVDIGDMHGSEVLLGGVISGVYVVPRLLLAIDDGEVLLHEKALSRAGANRIKTTLELIRTEVHR